MNANQIRNCVHGQENAEPCSLGPYIYVYIYTVYFFFFTWIDLKNLSYRIYDHALVKPKDENKKYVCVCIHNAYFVALPPL